ncbi:hypothetical protein G7054_g10698 [Neopestalotiopsis clavispora]|nr:hypothetical protein G7054_g10698 [Neopestalotiopsis clavispora]
MEYIVTSLLSLCGLLAFFLYQRQQQRIAAIRSHGCEPAVAYRSMEPFAAFDVQMKMFMDIPSLYNLHKQCGATFQPRAWVSPPTVCTIAPENINAINTSRDFGVEPMRLPAMEYFCGKGFITTDGDVWNQSRRLLKPSFDLGNVKDLHVLEQEVGNLIEKLPRDASTIDLQPLLYVMFLNSALHFVLGVDPMDQSRGAPLTADGFVQKFHKALTYSMFRSLLGPLWALVPKGTFFQVCAEAHGYLDHYIDQALAKPDSLKSRSLIQGLASQTNDQIFIRSQVIQAMMAAQDTTSELLTNALFLLARNPKYWAELRAEFVNRPESELSAECLVKCSILGNILRETLRLYPIFALMGRIALRDTTLPSGGGSNHDQPMFIPKGSQVVMSYYALHRDSNVFGPDVEEFRPERWATISPTQWEYAAFGGGNRACLGQTKAIIEASYVLARLSQVIEKLESRDERTWKGQLKLTCKSANGCRVAVHR